MSWRSPSTVPMTTVPREVESPSARCGSQEVEGALHGARAQQHLGDEAVAGAHALADDLHARKEGLLEDLPRAGAAGEQRLGEGVHGIGVAVDQGCFELVFHGRPFLLQATPAALSVSSTMAWMRAATSSGTGSGLYSWMTSRAFARQRW